VGIKTPPEQKQKKKGTKSGKKPPSPAKTQNGDFVIRNSTEKGAQSQKKKNNKSEGKKKNRAQSDGGAEFSTRERTHGSNVRQTGMVTRQ